MNPVRRIPFYSLILALVISTACMTLVPQVSEPAPSPMPTETEETFKPHTEPLEFDPPSLPNARVGVPYDVEIQVTGNVTPVGGVDIHSGILPPGLELIFEEDGTDIIRIAGTPETAGTYAFQIDVWCYGTQVSGQTGGRGYTLEVE